MQNLLDHPAGNPLPVQKPVITYSLRDGQTCSRVFYQGVAQFTDEVVSTGERLLGPVEDSFFEHLREKGGEAPRTREVPRTRAEYFLDLLMIGVLWGIYASSARRLTRPGAWFLGEASRLRERGPGWKKIADSMRGLFSAWLRPARTQTNTSAPLASLKDLDRLQRWMQAAGRLAQEARRVEIWRGFFTVQTAERVAEALAAVTAFSAWFEERSLAVLGAYTPQVERFLKETHPAYRWREDFILCGRQRVEYHLNMVGTEILNRALREAFQQTKKRIVLVPPCMAALPDDRCKAKPTPYGNRCAGCTRDCAVN
ncbi:MAG: DUF116 domain-containing protein, partial [Anaerolineaceae bacterium]|nr:DUF116 domain-containing protein [Anaerolineaceae bacterium]